MWKLACCLLFAAAVAAAPIRWEPFELPQGAPKLKAELGRLTIPLNRKRPESGPAEIAFVRLRAGDGAAGAPIVYVAGGPGDSGINAARNPYALPSLARLAATGDVILLDQRGIGMSSPRPMCAAPPVEPEERFVSESIYLERFLRLTRACVDEWTAKGVDVSGFNVAESAEDIEDLRVALGVPRVKLLAFSYGTHLSLAYIRAHEKNVERAVLIATAGLGHMRKLPFMLDTQLDKLSLLAGTDMAAQLRRILAKLEREPMMVTITDRARKKEVRIPIGPDALRGFLVADIGDGHDFPVFPALLETIERGDPSILEWFAEKRYNGRGMIDLMMLGMRCSAGATASRDQQLRAEAARSIFGNVVNSPFPDVCGVLPVPDLGDDYRGRFVSNASVLFISGTLDSNTPPYQAEELRWGMPNASHLIVANAGHEDLEPDEGVQAVIADYLAGKEVSERHVSLPRPRFRSIEEAKRERSRSQH